MRIRRMTWLSSSVPPTLPSAVAIHRAPSGARLMFPIDCVGSASAIGVQFAPLSHERETPLIAPPAKRHFASATTDWTRPLTKPAPPLLFEALGSRYRGSSEL